jgi:aspartyl-tRNA(Asn)/glutamyl-tRNA(Gln) amidotransferase subunit A
VSRFGLVAFASSLDQVGVFGRGVDDAAMALEAIAGHDPNDSTSASRPAGDYRGGRDASLHGLVVGRPREYFPADLERGVRVRCDAALEHLRSLGAEIRDVSLPHTELAIPVYYIVAPAEASSNLARFDGVRYGLRIDGDGLRGMYEATRSGGFGPEVTRRILLGTYVLSAGYYDAWYGRALKVRALLRRDFESAFEKVDVIAGPTTPEVAFKLGEKVDDPVAMYLSDVLTVPTSLAGIPGISVPCGFVETEGKRLPVGLQLVGPHRGDARVLRVARAFEAATDHARARPPHDASTRAAATAGTRGARA